MGIIILYYESPTEESCTSRSDELATIKGYEISLIAISYIFDEFYLFS